MYRWREEKKEKERERERHSDTHKHHGSWSHPVGAGADSVTGALGVLGAYVRF